MLKPKVVSAALCIWLATVPSIMPLAALAQASSCDLRKGDDGLKPTSRAARTDPEITDALKRAGTDNIHQRAEIIIQGVFGPCYNASARSNQFEVDWMRMEHEQHDRAKDVAAALAAVTRIVRLLKEHKIPLEARPINVFHSRFKPGDHTILYTVHWPAGVINRAVAAPQKAEELLRNGYKVADGNDPPREWFDVAKGR